MFVNPMARMTGVTAIGMAIGLSTLSTAQAQPDASTSAASRSVYSPPPAAASIYHPAPGRVYEPNYAVSAQPFVASDRPIAYETEDWLHNRDNRLFLFGIASLIVLLTTAGIFRVINTHKDEVDGKDGKV